MISSFRGPYAFLSNFHICSVYHRGTTFHSSEHAFQAAKTDDLEWIQKIAWCPQPTQAKKLGQLVPLRKNWESVKLDIMLEVLRSKFSDPTLKKLLLGTYLERLQEGNNHGDTFWGVCRGEGENNLGILLELLRGELR